MSRIAVPRTTGPSCSVTTRPPCVFTSSVAARDSVLAAVTVPSIGPHRSRARRLVLPEAVAVAGTVRRRLDGLGDGVVGAGLGPEEREDLAAPVRLDHGGGVERAVVDEDGGRRLVRVGRRGLLDAAARDRERHAGHAGEGQEG